MKRLNLILLLALTLAAVSCQTDRADSGDSMPGDKMERVTISATIGAGNKTTLNGYAVYWEAGDQIAVKPDGTNDLFVLTLDPDDDGKATGKFTGEMPSGVTGPFHAVYPAGVVMSGNDSYRNYFRLTVPATQTYRAGMFGSGANIAAADFTDLTQPVEFVNTGGLLRLTLKGSGSIARIVLTSALETEFLSGEAYLSETAASVPGVNFVAQENCSASITLACPGDGAALTAEGTHFFFYVPYGTLGNGFRVEVFDTDGGAMRVTAPRSEKNRIVRSDIKEMPALKYAPALPAAFISCTTPGIYDNCTDAATLELPFVAGGTQTYVTSDGATQTCSVVNWDKEIVVEYRMPAALTEGSVSTVTVVPVSGTSGIDAGTLTLECLQINEFFAWMRDQDTGKGYIFSIMQ